MQRRSFLKMAAATGLLSSTGCRTLKDDLVFPSRKGPYMATYKDGPIQNVRVGIIGLGKRGTTITQRLASIPGVDVRALCDLHEDRAVRACQQLTAAGKNKPAIHAGTKNAWRTLCEMRDLDLIYVCTPWLLHTPMAVYAMQCEKHVAVEMPAAVTLEQCWQLVDTSESAQRHCILLDSSAYGENELLAEMLCSKHELGQILYGEVSFIHDVYDRNAQFPDTAPIEDRWLQMWALSHKGNSFPYGVAPAYRMMRINRGDRFDILTSTSAAQSVSKTGRNIAKGEGAQIPGDMTITTLRSYRGKTLVIQLDTMSARPEERTCLISGEKGSISTQPLKIAKIIKASSQWLPESEVTQLATRYVHPLWTENKELLHGAPMKEAMDILMHHRIMHCLQRGRVMDSNVYEAATVSAIVELSEQSVSRHGKPVRMPDFTRGGWTLGAE